MASCIMTKHGEELQYSFEYQTYEDNQELWFECEDNGLVWDNGSCSTMYIGKERQKIIVPNSGNYTAKIYSPSTEIKGGYGTSGTYWVNWHKYINGTLIIGDRVESIPEYFMCECENLSQITLSTRTILLNNIGDFAFYKTNVMGTNGRMDIRNIENIGIGAFSWCKNIREFRVRWSNEKYSIGDNGCLIDNGFFIGDGFYQAESIHTYPAGNPATSFSTDISSIKPYAFVGASNLKTISFDGGLGNGFLYYNDPPYYYDFPIQPFEGCDNLENIYVTDNSYYSQDGILMYNDTVIFAPPKNTIYTLGAICNGLGTIWTKAFPYNECLETIYLKSTCDTVDYLVNGYHLQNPFKNCLALRGFIIDSLNYNDITPFWIRDRRLRAYARNSENTEETIYSSDVDIIETDAFYGTRLTTLNIENGIEIQDSAIPDYVNIVRF